jgi:hypothetical protein
MTSCHHFYANQSYIKKISSAASTEFLYQNLTPKQQYKLHLHERCAQANWEQLNAWIRAGILPCDPSLASEPDPVCTACQFGKAHKCSQKADTGHINKTHTDAQGDQVSFDGMEADCPGQPMTTSGLQSSQCYK